MTGTASAPNTSQQTMAASRARLLDEVDLLGAAASGEAAEDESAHERGDEAVAVDDEGAGVGQQRQGQHGGPAQLIGQPVPPPGRPS